MAMYPTCDSGDDHHHHHHNNINNNSSNNSSYHASTSNQQFNRGRLHFDCNSNYGSFNSNNLSITTNTTTNNNNNNNPNAVNRSINFSNDDSSDSEFSSRSFSSTPPDRSPSPASYSSSSNTVSLSGSPTAGTTPSTSVGGSSGGFVHSYKKPLMPGKSQYVALDCEMVGTLTGESVCARVVVVNWKGRPLLDTYVKPSAIVTDYRTFVSGITAEHLIDAPSLATVREKVLALVHDKIIVGHGLENDLKSLQMEHPWWMIRDTAYYQPFMQERYSIDEATQTNTKFYVPRKLKDLAHDKLQRVIQAGETSHSPIEDAVAALDLYKTHRPRWEACMTSEIQKAKQQQQRQHLQQQRQLRGRTHHQHQQKQLLMNAASLYYHHQLQQQPHVDYYYPETAAFLVQQQQQQYALQMQMQYVQH